MYLYILFTFIMQIKTFILDAINRLTALINDFIHHTELIIGKYHGI